MFFIKRCYNPSTQLSNRNAVSFSPVSVASRDSLLPPPSKTVNQSFDYNTFLLQKDNILKGFSVLHLNIQSLKAKFEALECLLAELNNFDVLCFSETWLTNDNLQCYELANYSHVPSIRNNRNGGTSIFIRNNIDYTVREDIKSEMWLDYAFEVTAIEINFGKKGFLVACLYRTPDSSINEFLKHFDLLLEKAISENKLLLVGGDFNIDLSKTNTKSQEFLNTIVTNNFTHLIDLPTRQSKQTTSCIDNFVINDPDSVNYVGVIETDISDHFALYIDLNLHKNKNRDNTKYSFYGRIKNETSKLEFTNNIFSEKWSEVYKEEDTNSKYNNFINTFVTHMNTCFPKRKISTFLTENNPWYTPELKRLNSLKYSLYKTRNTSSNLNEIYIKVRNYYTKSIKFAKRLYYQKTFQQIKREPRKTWKTLNGMVGRIKNTTGKSLEIKDENLITDPQNVADYMNNHFCNVGHSLGLEDHCPSTTNNMTEYTNGISNSFALFPITETEVINSILKLKPNKSPGYDEITSDLLKLSITSISRVLQHVFNASIESGIFPSRMKIAKVIPIYKKGNHLEVSNYRPISLLPVLSKCLESIMFNRLNSYINKYNLISPSQFGFQKGKSTVDAILSFLDKLNDHLDNKHVISVFCDLSKAFDCVNHKLLLTKLNKIGIRGIALKWFQSYLEGRLQYTVVKKYTKTGNETLTTESASNVENIKRGVPQGSILGPLLFTIYINDLPKINTNSDYILYADDTNILFSDIHMETLESKFESIMNSTSTWFKNNELVLNKEKSNFIQFGNLPVSNLPISQCPCEIKQITETKFLGITITSNMSWESHIVKVANKIKPAIAILYKVRNLVNTSTLLQIYHALVQSHINYGILIWGGSPQKYIETLLKLQKKAMRIIGHKDRLSSCRPLFSKYKILTVTSLYILESSCYAKKSLLVKTPPAENKPPIKKVSSIHSYNTRHQENIYIPKIPNNRKKLDILHRSSIIYNKLPDEIKEIGNCQQFRSVTRKFLLDSTLYKLQELN